MRGPDPQDSGISVRGVSKRFRHRDLAVEALQDVSLEVAPGEFVAVVGPSGCGKSTLLRVVAGLLEPDAGSVEVAGRPPRVARADKCFGLVPQSPSLLPWLSVLDNVTLLRELGRPPAARTRPGLADPLRLLEAVGLREFANSRPSQLSGGMRQRVSLVRAFALGAPVLLMDEPFASLDEITRETMQYQLLDIWGATSTTVVFVTHSVSEAVALADRVLAMAGRPGRVVHEERILLPRPRGESMEFSAAFSAHVQSLRTALREASAVPGR